MSWTKFATRRSPAFLLPGMLSLVLAASGWAQVITTLAGTNSLGPADGTAALSAAIGPNLVTADGQGNIYFIDQNTLVLKINAQGKISRFAGNGIRGFSGDGGPAIDASLNGPSGIFADAAGNVYIADTANYRIRKIDTRGIINTIAGNGQNGRSPDNTLAINAAIGGSYSVATDSASNVYFADSTNHRIAKIDSRGMLTTFAGTGNSGYSGDSGPASAARLNFPLSVTVDPSNNVVIADTNNFVLRIVNSSGVIRTFAGNGQQGFSGDNGPATNAVLGKPWTVSADTQGNILFIDYDNDVVRRVDTRGIITTVAGNGQVGLGGNNVSAVSSALYYPFSVAAEPAGSFLIADFSNNLIRRVSSAGLISTVAGNGFKVLSPNGGAASSAILAAPSKVAIDASGNLLIADWNNHQIERVNLSNRTIAAIAGLGRASYNGDGIAASGAALNFPQGITVDRSGNVVISDTFNHRIRRIDANGTISTIAGAGRSGFQGDNGPATSALLSVPQGLRYDAQGNLVFADSNNHVVRQVTTQGVIRTIAGTGSAGYNRDGVAATQAQLNTPTDVAFDSAGNLYIADSRNHRIRRVDTNGNITTVAGTGTGGFSGDGNAISAQLFTPSGVNFDARGNLLIADRDNNRIRLLTPGGQLQTVAGDGLERLAGDGGAATLASMARPEGVVADSAGNIYFADSRNDRIRQILAAPASFGTTPGPLQFNASSGGAVTFSQPISISGAVPGLAFTATASDPWILVSTVSGSMPVTISVSVDPATLPEGTARGRVTITSPLAAIPAIPVDIVATIAAARPPALSVSTTAVNLSIVRGGSGSSEANSRFRLTNSGGGSFDASIAASSAPWLQVTPASPKGITPGSPADVSVSTSAASLAPGTYISQLVVDGAAAGSVKVPVTLTIVEARPKSGIL